MKKIKLKESDLLKIVRRVVNESQLLNEEATCAEEGLSGDCGNCGDGYTWETSGLGWCNCQNLGSGAICHDTNNFRPGGVSDGVVDAEGLPTGFMIDIPQGDPVTPKGGWYNLKFGRGLNESQLLNENIVCTTHQQCKDESGDDRQKCDKGAGECYVPAGSGPPGGGSITNNTDGGLYDLDFEIDRGPIDDPTGGPQGKWVCQPHTGECVKINQRKIIAGQLDVPLYGGLFGRRRCNKNC